MGKTFGGGNANLTLLQKIEEQQLEIVKLKEKINGNLIFDSIYFENTRSAITRYGKIVNLRINGKVKVSEMERYIAYPLATLPDGFFPIDNNVSEYVNVNREIVELIEVAESGLIKFNYQNLVSGNDLEVIFRINYISK